MREGSKRLYVISDLHIGGLGVGGCRIFHQSARLGRFLRMLTGEAAAASTEGEPRRVIELVINGDFLDFLFEPRDDGRFCAFRPDPDEAERVFGKIVADEREAAASEEGPPTDGREVGVFAALRRFLAAGGRLTILLGNHDLELSFPNVRRALETELDARGKHFRFLYDGEAYVVGDVLIEHGNKWDPPNDTDYDGLREFRSHLSRRLEPPSLAFTPPLGSRVVEEFVGPCGSTPGCEFVAKIKPELSRPTVRLFWGLDPDRVQHSWRLFRGAIGRQLRDVATRARSAVSRKKLGADAAGAEEPPAEVAEPQGPEALLSSLVEDLSDEARDAFEAGAPAVSGLRRVQLGAGESRRHPLLSLKESDPELYWRRLESFVVALENLDDEALFSEEAETSGEIVDHVAHETGARPGALRARPFRVVVLGHTHLKKRAPCEDTGATYYNTGTWADLMRFPRELVGPAGKANDDMERAKRQLDGFLESLARGEVKSIRLAPYARLDFDPEDNLVEHGLFEFEA